MMVGTTPFNLALYLAFQSYILEIRLILIIFRMSGFQKGQTHFCSLSGSMENHGNACRIFSQKNFVENVQPGLAVISQPDILELRLTPIILRIQGF